MPDDGVVWDLRRERADVVLEGRLSGDVAGSSGGR